MTCKSFLNLTLLLIFTNVVTAGEVHQPQDIEFVADIDGTKQRYVMIAPVTTQKKPVDILIALHGHGSDRWQFIKLGRGEPLAARDIAKKYGMVYISPDYRAKTSWMGPKAEADVVQIIAELKKKFSVRRVYICGASMGGSSCLTFAALHPELIDGVASMNGTVNHLEYERFQDAIAKSFGGTKSEIPEEYKKRSAEYWPERLTMPIGATTGGKDASVPPQSVTRLAIVLNHLNRPVMHLHREKGGHSTTYDDAIQILEFMIKESQK